MRRNLRQLHFKVAWFFFWTSLMRNRNILHTWKLLHVFMKKFQVSWKPDFSSFQENQKRIYENCLELLGFPICCQVNCCPNKNFWALMSYRKIRQTYKTTDKLTVYKHTFLETDKVQKKNMHLITLCHTVSWYGFYCKLKSNKTEIKIIY